ncbi:MAG TPA: hypothetical protein VGC95_03315, partial [Chitinophagaceae bacterium]
IYEKTYQKINPSFSMCFHRSCREVSTTHPEALGWYVAGALRHHTWPGRAPMSAGHLALKLKRLSL